MNTRRTTFLIAAILAVATGWLTLTYVTSLRAPSTAQRAVLITTQEVPAREKITDAMFTREMRPGNTVQPDAISDPSQAVGSLALITIPVGSQLTASSIGTNVAFALPVRLQPGMRAVSIPVDRVKDVSGLVQPGDRVDVIAIPPPRSNGPPPHAATIFRGIRVLAVGNALENPSATPPPDEQTAATVTLEVTPKQADLLAWADANATLRLALRSPSESIHTEPVEELTLAGSGGPSVPSGPPQFAPALPPAIGSLGLQPPPKVADPPHGPVSPVELIVGDQIVDPGSSK
jgi:pilus assembly protein CpaB